MKETEDTIEYLRHCYRPGRVFLGPRGGFYTLAGKTRIYLKVRELSWIQGRMQAIPQYGLPCELAGIINDYKHQLEVPRANWYRFLMSLTHLQRHRFERVCIRRDLPMTVAYVDAINVALDVFKPGTAIYKKALLQFT